MFENGPDNVITETTGCQLSCQLREKYGKGVKWECNRGTGVGGDVKKGNLCGAE